MDEPYKKPQRPKDVIELTHRLLALEETVKRLDHENKELLSRVADLERGER